MAEQFEKLGHPNNRRARPIGARLIKTQSSILPQGKGFAGGVRGIRTAGLP